MYFNGQGVLKDYAAALSWARKAADQGDARALSDIGLAAYTSGDYATALRLLRPLADKGFVKPQLYLGLMYANGQGVPRNDAAAVSWYRKAADKDYSPAQNNLGNMYDNGQGVPQDYATAVKWYRKAADHNHTIAQNNLGLMYANGHGVPQDYVTAHMWLNLAAARGYKGAAQHRDKIAAQMTSAQIAEAQKLDREWLQKINAAPMQAPQGRVPLKMDGGTFVVPVQINGTMTLDFIIDSGAADVSVPADVVSTLMRAGAIREPEFIGENTYVLADGSKTKSPTFTIRTLRVGNTVLENVRGSVASSQGSLLLGQSFLNRFKSWSIDNTKQELLLEPR
jgi:clan AA aspartic protease (TIGR02281 family)